MASSSAPLPNMPRPGGPMPMSGQPMGPGGPHMHPGAAGGPPPGMGVPPQASAQSSAILDAIPFTPVPYALRQAPPRPPGVPPALPLMTCAEHGEAVCKKCDVDFKDINYLGVFMPMLAQGQVPPPPQIQYGKQAEVIKQTREEGNAHFKAGRYPEAITLYTRSIERSLSRPPWENTGFTRDEMSSALLNRAAAAAALGDWASAFADADACTKLNPRNAKAYFRKAKALVGMERVEDAHAVILRGLVVEPENAELKSFADDLRSQLDASGTVPSATEKESSTAPADSESASA